MTFPQINVLYNELQKVKIREYKLQASLHGVKFKESKTTEAAENPKVPLFRDPSEYDGMSEEQRNEETKRMMGLHKKWSGDAIPNEKID